MPERQDFDRVYEEFLPRIYGFLMAQLRNPTEAEDLTAQVFIKAYAAYDRFEARHASPAAWLFQIARNALLDHHRRRQSRERTERQLAYEVPFEPDPAEVTEQRLTHTVLLEHVRRLPDRQRQVVGLRHRSGLGFAEIGSLMGCSEDAAKMLYHRALKALRTSIGGALDA